MKIERIKDIDGVSNEISEKEKTVSPITIGVTKRHLDNVLIDDNELQSIFLKDDSNSKEQLKYKKMLEDYVRDLDDNTSESFSDKDWNEYSEAELKELWENDPGYINEKAYKELPSKYEIVNKLSKMGDIITGKESPSRLEANSPYVKFGLHIGNGNYRKDLVEGTEKDNVLPIGKIIERRGDDKGSYFCEPGTDFKNLHINVSEDKRPKSLYEVLKPLHVKESVIARQPFDNKREYKQGTIQYKTAVKVIDLIELGFLKKIEHK